MVQHISHIQELQTALSESLTQLPEKAYNVAGAEELGRVECQNLGRLALNKLPHISGISVVFLGS